MLVSIAAQPAQAVTYYAAYKLSGGTVIQSNQTFSATATDTSGVWVFGRPNQVAERGRRPQREIVLRRKQ